MPYKYNLIARTYTYKSLLNILYFIILFTCTSNLVETITCAPVLHVIWHHVLLKRKIKVNIKGKIVCKFEHLLMFWLHFHLDFNSITLWDLPMWTHHFHWIILRLWWHLIGYLGLWYHWLLLGLLLRWVLLHRWHCWAVLHWDSLGGRWLAHLRLLWRRQRWHTGCNGVLCTECCKNICTCTSYYWKAYICKILWL